MLYDSRGGSPLVSAGAIPIIAAAHRGMTMPSAWSESRNDVEALVGTPGPGDAAENEAVRDSQDAREYARRLRSLPVDQIVGEVLFGLLNAAEVKLGRRDARLLIDVTTVAHDHARPYLPGQLTERIDQVLGQLRLGQVSAESQAGQGVPEENDLDRVPAPPSARAAQ
jgi:hypothetical protein